MNNYTKYTKELLEPLVKDSISVAEVLRKLGKKQCGGVHTNLSKVIKKLGIDTTHFLGQASCRGKAGPNKKSWQEVLIKRSSDRRETSYRLRRALVESGREYKCEICGRYKWNKKILVLQVDHKNGDFTDDRKENLRFLCPNCHTQTPNHSGSNGMTDLFSIARYNRIRRKKKQKTKIKKQKNKKPKGDPNWRTKPRPKQRKAERPPLDVLLNEVKQNGYSATGRKYGVSDNAIRKWIKWENENKMAR